jgi:DNA-binding transcriptional ArsR family regulator
VNKFDAVSDPARRRMLEVLISGGSTAGQLGDLAAAEFGISQPATSRHLRVLREAGLVLVQVDGTKRVYTVNPDGLHEIDQWLDQFRFLWSSALSALNTEIRRGQRFTGN